MNNLIVSQNQTLTMSSREIAEFTNKQHKHVIRDINRLYSELYGHGPELDHVNVEKKLVDGIFVATDSRAYVQYYLLDRKHTDCLLTGYSAIARMKVIERWHELENKQAPQLPQSFAEALQLAADQAKQLELAAPKVEFHDKIVNDEKTFSFRDAAKKIQQRPNKLIEWLRDNGYLCLNNIAKQQYITQGLFATHTGVSDAGHHYTQCRVTSKGLSYFTSKLGDEKL